MNRYLIEVTNGGQTILLDWIAARSALDARRAAALLTGYPNWQSLSTRILSH